VGGVRASGRGGEGEPEKRSHDKKGLNRGCVAGGKGKPHPSINRSGGRVPVLGSFGVFEV